MKVIGELKSQNTFLDWKLSSVIREYSYVRRSML